MFNYMVLNAYSKPYQCFAQIINEKANKEVYLISQESKRDELKIYDYFIEKGKTTIALIANSKEADLYAIEKLKLHGFIIDKLLVEELSTYNITKYNYIITNPLEINSTKIKNLNNENCSYEDKAKITCKIPFEYFKKYGFEEIETKKFNNYKILKRNLIH